MAWRSPLRVWTPETRSPTDGPPSAKARVNHFLWETNLLHPPTTTTTYTASHDRQLFATQKLFLVHRSYFKKNMRYEGNKRAGMPHVLSPTSQCSQCTRYNSRWLYMLRYCKSNIYSHKMGTYIGPTKMQLVVYECCICKIRKKLLEECYWQTDKQPNRQTNLGENIYVPSWRREEMNAARR